MGARKGLPYKADSVPQASHPDGPLRNNSSGRRINGRQGRRPPLSRALQLLTSGVESFGGSCGAVGPEVGDGAGEILPVLVSLLPGGRFLGEPVQGGGGLLAKQGLEGIAALGYTGRQLQVSPHVSLRFVKPSSSAGDS